MAQPILCGRPPVLAIRFQECLVQTVLIPAALAPLALVRVRSIRMILILVALSQAVLVHLTPDCPILALLVQFACRCLFRCFRLSGGLTGRGDRKSTRLNSSHVAISYAIFCLKKIKNK